VAGGGANADRQRAHGHSSAECATTHRYQPAPGISPMHELVCHSISAEREGAVPGKALLVAAGLIRLVIADAVKAIQFDDAGWIASSLGLSSDRPLRPDPSAPRNDGGG
jgi:hypothetical protein